MLLGFDIGGTKCAVITALKSGEDILLKNRQEIPTDFSVSPEAMLERLISLAEDMLGKERPESIGVSCGGPLDSKKGLILSPPNLPGWDRVPVLSILTDHFKAPAHLQNDANACAVAEWKFGAGKGCRNMIFLTFGTGLGAGLILDNRLYSGTNDNAGEAGHIRLEEEGPVGYGKAGSFEGFCSGGGIKKLGIQMAEEAQKNGITPLYAQNPAVTITAKSIAEAAHADDPTALQVYKICGEHLGKGLSILIDLLNPEKIVIGSIFARSQDLLWKYAKEIIDKEALPLSSSVCQVVPASLGEKIGDYAAIGVALLED